MNSVITSCVVAQATLVAVLGLGVSMARAKTRLIYYGEPMDPASILAKRVRAHGNAAEYAGVLSALFLATGWVYESTPIDTWVRVLIAVMTIARYLGAIGFLTCASLAKIHPLKAISALCTYGGIVVLGMHVLVKVW